MRHFTHWLTFAAWWLALASTALSQSAVDGNTYLTEVLAMLERHPTILARLRHQAQLGEAELVGSGNYWQGRTSTGQRINRWEMRTQVAGKTSSLLQVFDGNYLWTDRLLPSGRTLRRLDVATLHMRLRSARSARQETANNNLLASAALGRGGLPELLADLLTRFTFDKPRPTQLNGLAVNALIGHWRKPELERLWPEAGYVQDGEPLAWPDQLPHHVLVLVGRNLFPYLLEHRTAEDGHLATSTVGLRPAHDPLLRYEVYDVHLAAVMEPKLFQLERGDLKWTDETSLVLERMNPRVELP